MTSFGSFLRSLQGGDGDTADGLEEANRKCIEAVHNGEYSQAAAIAATAISSAERSRPNSPVHAQLLHNRAFALAKLGSPAEAEPLYRKAIEIEESRSGGSRRALAQSCNALASVCAAQGRLAEATELHRKALKMLFDEFGDEHINVAHGLNDLGLVLQAQHRFEESETFISGALAIFERELGADHEEVAMCLNNLGMGLNAQRKYSAAEIIVLKRALSIFEAIHGTFHRDVAAAMSNLADLYTNIDRWDDAERLTRLSLAIKARLLGDRHPSVAAGLNLLAQILKAKQHWDDAETTYRQAIEIAEECLGGDALPVGIYSLNLGVLYGNVDRPLEAETLIRRAAGNLQLHLASDHPWVRFALEELGKMQRRAAAVSRKD